MAEGLSSDELIRLRAHAIWVAEGEPKGREKEHWERARREIAREISAPDQELDAHALPTRGERPARLA